MMPMLYFGKFYLGEHWDDNPTIAPPPMACFRCGEWIELTDSGVVQSLVSMEGPACIAYHHECHARMVLGSLGHQQRRCSCYGGTEEDPPEMTVREAAKAALAFFRREL